ncbi:uncharacterized protein V2V93DRAFT_376442 [Kockiozyma suomiensis]|uniref:uncharacterized protein n=1 Tax=Kockiozyma suomiensis TaxID=1337062 RepID=UPI0033438B4F
MSLISLLRPRLFSSVNLFSRSTISTPSTATATTTMTASLFEQQIRGVKTVKGYKMKTHTGAAARWHKTKSGKYKHAAVGKNHGNAGWPVSVISRAYTRGVAHGPGQGNHLKRIGRLMPYSK